MNDEHYAGIFRSVVGGRKWIVATDVAAGATGMVAWLREHGAPDPFVVAGSRGTGELPDVRDENVVMLDTTGASIMEAIRSFHEAAHAPLPPAAQRRLDEWDPGEDAKVFASFLDDDRPIGGRAQFGARPPAWLALEDKTMVDALWDKLGIQRAAMGIFDLDARSLGRALADLDEGAGVVVTGDNRLGWHGGADLIRVVKVPADIEPALEYLGPRSHRARVMPYLEGIPCSIHGVVFADHVVTVRPVEMVVLYEPAHRRFRYGSAASTWEPPPADTAYMREVAVRVGTHLRAEHGYRGAFTIDGVMSRTGFLPTELNPRAGAGLRAVATESPNPFALHTVLVAGVEADWWPRELEEHWRTNSREPRGGRGLTTVRRRFTQTDELPVRFSDGAWCVVEDGDQANGTLTRGPAGSGGVIFIEFDPGVVEQGRSAAPVVAAGFALADGLWGTNIGPLEPATDVRAEGADH